MNIIPNHHVIVPKTKDFYIEIPNVVTSLETKRQAHVQRAQLISANTVALEFSPVSDQWIELYLDNYRIVNPKYATFNTPGVRYDEYNLDDNNVIRFQNPQTGKLTIVCDTIQYTAAENLINFQPAGAHIRFENLQSHDVFEKHFTPSRYPMPQLGLEHTVIRVRIGDAHYSEPVVLAQPCHGFVRLSRDRRGLVYVPRAGFRGYDVFGYTLMSQHGQMGLPASGTVRVGGPEEYYNYSAKFDGNVSCLAIRDHKHASITSLATKQVTIEFYYFCSNVDNTHDFKVGLFGQYKNKPVNGRYAVYLQGTSTTSDQVVVLEFCISTVDLTGNPVFANYKASSKARLSQLRWHHIVLQIDATNPNAATLIMYLDGYAEYFYNLDFTSQNINNNEYFLIGRVNDDSRSQILNGYISNFRFLLGSLPYSGERIRVPERTLANVATAKILGIVNHIHDPQSIQDMSDITRLQKVGNVDLVTEGPFSPLLLSLSTNELVHGETLVISTRSDYICRETVVNWQINANVSVGRINSAYVSKNALNLTTSRVNQVGVIKSSTSGFTGNFIVDDVDQVFITVDTKTSPLQSKRRVDFALVEYPLVIETFDILAEPNGLVANIEATNDGFARDTINFNHGNLTSISNFNSSLGGYFTFNGVFDKITGQNSKIIDITGDVSCEIWFRIQNSTTGNSITLLSKGVDGNLSYEINYTTSSNTITFKRDRIIANVDVSYTHTGSILSQWFQVVAVSSGERQQIYINGQKEIDDYYTPEPSLSNNMGYVLGTKNNIDFHEGQISIVKIYNRGISSTEVLNSFNTYRTRYGL